MTAQQTADVIANAREAVAKGSADYLERTIVALADTLESCGFCGEIGNLHEHHVVCNRCALADVRAELAAIKKATRAPARKGRR